MNDQPVDVKAIKTVWGDRVLVKRLDEPPKKRGLYIPAAYASKKEPRKVWWAEVVAFGEESTLCQTSHVSAGDVVGIEPLGHHYASFLGEDGHTYVWVPDEHFCLADTGAVAAYYADRLDRADLQPALRLLGARVLLRPAPDAPGASRLHRPPTAEAREAREARVADVVMVGELEDEDGKPKVAPGDRVLHVAEESGASALVDLYDPPLTVLRATDLIGALEAPVDATVRTGQEARA